MRPWNRTVGMTISLLLSSATSAVWGGEFFYGDMNCDGEINLGDVNPFVLALSDPGGYAATFPDCDLMNGDMNGDGRVDFGDINLFVSVLADPGPYLQHQSNTDCVGWGWWCDPDEIVLMVEGHTLHVVHRNAEYNCCLDRIEIWLEMQGNILRFTEEEVLSTPCFCICCFGAEATVVNLPSGLYTVIYCWFDYDTQQIECYEDKVVIP